ncbi:MAG: hypothetical protein PHN92_02890 [Geobacter sp.]|nr:hypothetical protein [Geobacter sp.]
MKRLGSSREAKQLRIPAAAALEFLQFAMAEGMVVDLEGEKG